MKKAFKKSGLKKLLVLLTIEEGKVRSIQLKNLQGKSIEIEALEKILGRVVFSSSIQGKMELELLFV